MKALSATKFAGTFNVNSKSAFLGLANASSTTPLTLIVTVDTPSPLRPASVVSFLREQFEFALTPNWDGEGALPLEPPVVLLAQSIIANYAGSRHLIDVSPGVDGGLAFVWDDLVGSYIYLDIGPGQTIHLFYNLSDGQKWEGVGIAENSIIREHLTIAFQKLYSPTPTFAVNIPVPHREQEYRFAL